MNSKRTTKIGYFIGLVFAAAVVAAAAVFLPALNGTQAQSKDDGNLAAYSKADAVTSAVRSGEYRLYRVGTPTAQAKTAALQQGLPVEDYGSFVVIAAKNGTGSAIGDAEEIPTTVSLPGGTFDPIRQKRSEGDLNWSATGGLYIVQLATPANDSLFESIKESGAEIIQYVSHNSYFVYASTAAVEKLQNHSRVRWIGSYKPSDKLSADTKRATEKLAGGSEYFDIAIFKRGDFADDYLSVAAVSNDILSVEKSTVGFFDIVTARLSDEQLTRIAELENVFRIDPYVEPVAEDERAAQIVAGNYTGTSTISAPGYDPATQFGVDGSNVTVTISDDGVSIPGNGGFYLTSGNTVDGPLRGATAGADGGHGHINASIVAGSSPFGALDPTGYNYGRGVAPGAHIINIPFLKAGNTTTDAQSVDDTVSTSGPNGVKGSITNNSWGAGTNSNSYDSRAALWDGFVFDASLAATVDPINIVFSAGNSGTSGLTRPKVAKNVISVANAENLRSEIGGTFADNIDDMRSSSSRGPAADGRIKPDITAPGAYISGSRAGTGGSVSGHIDANHSYSIGTSHSAPLVAGAAALFTQFWKNANGGLNPSPSLLKAALLNTGQEMNGLGTTSALPNGDEGWGRLNLNLALNTGVPVMYKNETTVFSEPGVSNVTYGVVADASKPVRIALVWTDPPAASDPALVNNLNLTVTVGANVYKGNVLTGGLSVPGGNADSLNNVEMVRLPAGIAAGTGVAIDVSSVALNGDGVPGNADLTDQTFSLVAYNIGDPVAASNAKFDFDGDAKTDIGIFRPAPGEWWYLRSGDGGNNAFQFGASTDKIVPADYTGDGKTDVAFFRPSTSEWFVLRSEDGSFFSFPFGSAGDIPAPGDFDGDGKADPAVFRPSTATWYILNSGGGTTITSFGANGDLPLVADYDNDGKDDVAIYRPSVQQYWINRSGAGLIAFQFGSAGDRAFAADFTGDGTDDAGFFRPSTGEWFILRSDDGSFFSFPFGTNGDIPVPGDYDGDGTADPAVFRPSNNTWFKQQSTSGFEAITFGATNDRPVPGAFITP